MRGWHCREIGGAIASRSTNSVVSKLDTPISHFTLALFCPTHVRGLRLSLLVCQQKVPWHQNAGVRPKGLFATS